LERGTLASAPSNVALERGGLEFAQSNVAAKRRAFPSGTSNYRAPPSAPWQSSLRERMLPRNQGEKIFSSS